MRVLHAKGAVYRDRQGQMHSLNNAAGAENVLTKVNRRQTRMLVGVNVMTLTVDIGIPPGHGEQRSQKFVP